MSRCYGCIWFIPKWFRCSKFHLWIWDVQSPCKDEKPSNADKIRSMTDEELALQLYLLRLDALHLEGFEGQIETKEEVLEWLKEEWTQDLEEVDT